MMLTRLLLTSLMLTAAACTTTGGEGEGETDGEGESDGEGEGNDGEGEGNDGEGEGNDGEGEGNDGEGEGDSGEGEGEADEVTSQLIGQLLADAAPFFSRCQLGLALAVDGATAVQPILDQFVNQPQFFRSADTQPDLAAFEACTLLLEQDDCDLITAPNSPCGRLFVGTRISGAACVDSTQCDNGLCRYPPEGGNCGVCTPGTTCFATIDCPGDQVCSLGLCIEPSPLGEPCDTDSGCEGDAICSFEVDESICVAAVPDGGSCANANCGRNSTCSTNDVCRPLPVAGQACAGQCQGELACLNGICAVPLFGSREGDPCSTTFTSSCRTNETGLFCAADGLCAPVVVVEVGGACDEAARFCGGSQLSGLSACIAGVCVAGVESGGDCISPQDGRGPPCVRGTICEDSRCEPLPVAAEPCEGLCADGAICSPAGRCEVLAEFNGPCGADSVCGGQAACVDSTCLLVTADDICPIDG